MSISHKDARCDAFTIELWVYPKRLEGWGALRNDVGWEPGVLHLQFKDDTLMVAMRSNNPVDQNFAHSFSVNQWQHIAVVYSVATKTVTLYVNGAFSEVLHYSGMQASV
jgi:hypothetical protein